MHTVKYITYGKGVYIIFPAAIPHVDMHRLMVKTIGDITPLGAGFVEVITLADNKIRHRPHGESIGLGVSVNSADEWILNNHGG